MSKIIGIDLGTTNSCVAVIEGGKPVVIPTALGSRVTKSVVRFVSDGQPIVGEHAYRTRLVDPKNTVSGIKRFIGRRYNEIFDIAQTVPFKIIIGQNNLAMIESYGHEYSPQFISAMILKSLTSAAEEYLEQAVNKAVITIPAYFNDAQREATREAGRMAGLEVMRIINEPTAAAMAYRAGKKGDEVIAVFDLGGGTFDISILDVGEGVLEVVGVSGDNFLGGDDFDAKLVNWIVEEFALETGLDVSTDPVALQLIREAAITAKCELSVLAETFVTIPFLPFEGKNINGPNLVLTRSKFDEICDELFQRLINPCEVALKHGGVKPEKIDKIILVGGATRMPRITEVVKRAFGKGPNRSVNPDESVALGAAIQAGVLSGDKTDVLLLDLVAKPLGIECANGTNYVFIEGHTSIPTRKSDFFSTALDHQTSVEIHILEGDAELAVDNRSLGRFLLDRIPPLPRGTPEIEVVIDVDANGIVIVSAKETSTGRQAKLTLRAATGLSDDDRARRVSDIREI